MRTRLDLQPILGPSLLEMLHDLVFMEMQKLGSFSLGGSSPVNVMALISVPNKPLNRSVVL